MWQLIDIHRIIFKHHIMYICIKFKVRTLCMSQYKSSIINVIS